MKREFFNAGFLRCFSLVMNGTMTAGTGTQNGISLILYVGSQDVGTDGGEYNTFSATTASTGVKVVIHPQGSVPDLTAAGLDVMPGHSTTVAMRSEHVMR